MPLRRLVVSSVALALLVLSPIASAGDKDVCATAYESAQRSQRRGALLSAREALLVCLRECSDVAKPECARWLGDVEDALPSIVVTVKRDDGSDVPDAVVKLDKSTFVADGRRVELDPGTHEIVVEVEGQRITQPVVIREGEKARPVNVSLKSAAAAPVVVVAPPPPLLELPSREDPPKRVPVATWVLGGVGALGLATFAGFSLYGNSRYSDLEECRPTCSKDEVSSVKTTYLVGDIALGAGLVALAAASVVYVLTPRAASAAVRAPLIHRF